MAQNKLYKLQTGFVQTLESPGKSWNKNVEIYGPGSPGEKPRSWKTLAKS